MIRDSEFGIKQIFDERFDKKDYKTNSKSFNSLIENLENLSKLDKSDDLYVMAIHTEFRKHNEIYEKLKTVMTSKDISLFIDLNYDLLKLLALIEPKRHMTFHLYSYPNTKVTKKVNQLEYEILERISEQFRDIAETNGIKELAKIQDIAEIFSLPQKKRTWKFWHK